jgi:hypothetical protein
MPIEDKNFYPPFNLTRSQGQTILQDDFGWFKVSYYEKAHPVISFKSNLVDSDKIPMLVPLDKPHLAKIINILLDSYNNWNE